MIGLHLKDRVYELSLNRPPCNEIGTEMLAELERCLEEIDVKKASALVLHSTLDTGFCAGADLREFYREMLKRPQQDQPKEMRKFLDRVHTVMNRIDMLPITTIGVIRGACFGGGLELALTCDILIAEPTARFCFPELRLGIIPGFGGIPRLKRDVGNGLVRDLLLTGRSINAKKALAAGLVSQGVGENEGLNVARKMAEQTTHFDSEAREVTKRFVKPIPEAELELEKELFIRLFQRPVVTNALKKFVNSDDLRPYLPA